MLVDLPGLHAAGGNPVEFAVPPGSGGFLARRRQEGYRDQVEKTYRANLERRLHALELRLQEEPNNFQVLREMGLMALLEGHFERANALLELAHAANGEDLEIHVNYAIVLAQRGQLQPALSLLEKAIQRWPNAPIVLYNRAVVALQARRAPLVFECVGALEKLWADNPDLASQMHDNAVTLRGLAFLLDNKPREAMRELDAAARHVVRHVAGRVERISEEGDDDTLEVTYQKEGEDTQLEGRTAEADALNNLAIAEAAMGEMDRALQRLQAALQIEPGHPQVLNNLGVLAYRQGRLNVAHRYLELARQVEESLGQPQPTTFNHLGVVLAGLGHLDDALEKFQHAGASEHAEFEVFYNLGRAFIEHGKPDRGVEYLRHAFSQEPNNADVHTVLGAAYLFRGRTNLLAEALKHLKRALQVDPHHRSAAVDLALALVEIKNSDAAKKLMEQAHKLFRDDPGVPYLEGLLTLERSEGSDENHWATAAQFFDAAYALRPELTSSLYNSAVCQFLMGFRDTSAKLLEAAAQRDPSLGPAYYMIGFGHAVAKRNDEALKAWQIAVQYEADNPDLHSNIGALLYRKADYAGSARYYMNAHRLRPQEPTILAALGVSFAQQKLYNQAVTALEQSLALDPRSPICHSNIGLAYYLFKQVEKAMEHWRIVSRLDSRYAASREGEQERSFDDSIVQLTPLNWRTRIVGLAPVLPRPRTRLVPGANARAYRPAMTDPSLEHIVAQKREVERASRLLAWMALRA